MNDERNRHCRRHGESMTEVLVYAGSIRARYMQKLRYEGFSDGVRKSKYQSGRERQGMLNVHMTEEGALPFGKYFFITSVFTATRNGETRNS